MQLAVPVGQGGMAAVLSLTADQVAEVCQEAAQETGLPVAAANLNSPGQTVIFARAGCSGKGLCAGQGQRRAARFDATGQRSLPLPP